MEKLKKYLLHSSGFYGFVNWLGEINKAGFVPQLDKQIIRINPLFSQYLSFGISTTKKSKGIPFIAIPPQEARWFAMLNFKYIVLRKKDNTVYFITESQISPTNIFPDLPSFGIAFHLDINDKVNLLESVDEIVIREYFIEDNGALFINYHNEVNKIKILHLNAEEPIPFGENVGSYDVFLKNNISIMNDYGAKFQGKLMMSQINGNK